MNDKPVCISLWCLLASPLLIGCDMTQLDEFTLGLLTNDEVLDVNQDPLGRQAARVAQNEAIEVWAKDLEDGSEEVIQFRRPIRARYLKFVAISEQNGQPFAAVAELEAFEARK